MYIPRQFLMADDREMIAFIMNYNFATIVTAQDDFPVATHLPFVVEQHEKGLRLFTHFAKANGQWQQARENTLVIFSEPHAYVSPSLYEHGNNVPTWNYLSVHAYGQSRIITSQDEAIQVLEKQIAAYEPGYKDQWDQLPDSFKVQKVKGIVCIEITVRELQGKKKLSQNRTKTERKSIITSLRQQQNENALTIASYMEDDLHGMQAG